MERKDRLKQARVKRGFATAKDAAEYLDIPYGTYSGHEAGSRGIKDDELQKYAAAFRVPVGWLAFGEGAPAFHDEIPIIGYIGAGAEILPEFEQVPPEGLDQVRLPFAVPEEMIGLEVRGDSMIPKYDDGDVVVCWREQRRDTKSFLGEEAAVRTGDGRRFLKRIMRGPSPGTFNLESINARTIEGIRVEWVGEIFATLPRGQIRRIEARDRAAAGKRARARATLSEGTGELPLSTSRRAAGDKG